MGKLNNWFKMLLDYLVMVACILLMLLLLVMTNPSSTVDLQVFSTSMIRWSETAASSALDHLKESYALVHLPSDNRHHYS